MSTEGEAARGARGLRSLRAALRALTVVGRGAGTRPVDATALYYPVVGLALGTIYWAADAALAGLGRAGASAAVVALGVLLTGGRPLLALARLGAAVASRRAGHLVSTSPAPWPPLVLACAVGLLACEIAGLAQVDRLRNAALLFAPLLARCSMVVVGVGSRDARTDGRRVKFAPGLTFNGFAWASTVTFAVVFLVTEFLGLLMILATATLALSLRVAFHRWLGGVNETALDASCEAAQLLLFVGLGVF